MSNININAVLDIMDEFNRENQAARKIQRVFREGRKRNAAAKIIQKYFRYSRESWKLLLYNGVVKDASLGSYIRDIWEDTIKRPLPKAIKEVSIIYDPSTKEISYTREYGVKGSSSRYNGIRWSIFFNGKSHSVALYKNGDIHFTGGYGENVKTTQTNTNQKSKLYTTPSDVLRIALGRWTSRNYTIELNNITLQKRFSNTFKLSGIQEIYPQAVYESELVPFLYIRKKGFMIKVTTSGIITIQGVKTVDEIRNAIRETNALVSTFPVRGVAKMNIKPQTTKRRNNNIAPNVKSRATTCPKDKCPVPNTFEGKCKEGYYLAPNPQGFPCCYKIPVKTAYKKDKIIAAFAKLGIAIPEHTKKVFQITNVNNKNKPKLVSSHVGNYRFIVTKNRKGGDVFKIDSRQCKRYTIPKLVDIAMKLGLIQAAKSRDKETLCSAIFRYAANKGIVNPKNNIPRIGGRSCMHYTKDELRRVVRSKYGITLRSETLAGMCAELKERRISSSSSSSMSSFGRNIEASLKRRRSSSSSSSMSSFGRNIEASLKRRRSSSMSSFARNIEASLNKRSPNINKAFQNFNVRKFLLKHTNRAEVTNAEILNFKKRVYPKIKNANEGNVPNILKSEARNMFKNLPGRLKVGGVVIKETM